ncbi:MAG: hypothetical protein ACK4PH_05930 [Aquincola tertiaricarbonis]
MTVLLKPVGPGNWTPMTLSYDGRHTAPLLWKVGERVQLGGVVWRVCRITS